MRYSTNLTGMTLSGVQAVFTAHANVALKKDSANDYRACIAMNVASLTSFAPGPDAPDPCYTEDDMSELHDDGYNVTLVSDLGNNGVAGWSTEPSDPPEIAIDWIDESHNTVVHELGHTVGNTHRNNWLQIMHEATVYNTSLGLECTKADANNYD